MLCNPGATFHFIVNVNGSSGLQDFDGGSFTAEFFRNGVVDSTVPITVSNASLGCYIGSGTLPYTYQAGDTCWVVLSGNVDGLAISVVPEYITVELPETSNPNVTPPTVGATYPIGTPLGDVRFYAGDTNIYQAMFSDSELLECLANASQVSTLAASFALEAAASDASKLSFLVKIGEYTKDATKLAAELHSRADRLRKISIVSPVVVSPNPAFMPNFPCEGGSDGSLNLW